MTVNNLKLGVDVVSAYNLKPKDGQGSCSAYVELYFDGQRYQTTVKDKDLSPVWDESFYFSISDPSNLQHLNLEAYVYSTIRGGNGRSLLGKVSVSGTSFAPHSDAQVLQYPLTKYRVFSSVRGEIRLKVYVTDDPSVNSSTLLPSANLMNGEVHQAVTQVSQVESKAMRAEAVKAETPPPKIAEMHPTSVAQLAGVAIRETHLDLGGGMMVGSRIPHPDKRASTNDFVEIMEFLYVRIVKARGLPTMDTAESLDHFVEVKVGSYKGVTKHTDRNQNPFWDVVFAFSMEWMQTSALSVVVKYKHLDKDDSVGIVRIDLNEVPTRVPPDSPLAPQFYRLEGNMGERIEGELMLSVWNGTQADEAYHEAWHVDPTIPIIDLSAATRTQFQPKMYVSPKLWYLRVTVIEAQDLQPTDRTCFPQVYVQARVGNQVVKTRTLQTRTLNPVWNEDLFFVVAEPFVDCLVLTVENNVSPGREEILGIVTIPPVSVERRMDYRLIRSRWYPLEKPTATDAGQLKEATRLHLRVCLDGGYHVLDESTRYSSDLRPTAKQLWKPPIGLLEIAIREAEQIHPMKTRDGRETSDAYCIAKYGQKWVRTRTIIDSLFPKYNEQYTWEVYDRATVLTVGVFDNSQYGAKGSNGSKDLRIGKVEIRLSALEIGRVHTHVYPLLDLRFTGVKTMGRLHLAVRFSCTSFTKMLYQYTSPLLPKMHYVGPISSRQQETLRHQAVNIVTMRLKRAEPALHKEVVEYMCEARSHLWSMRRSKANFSRLMFILSGLREKRKWFDSVCSWENPHATILVHILFLVLVLIPVLILPMFFLYMFLIVVCNYRYRPKHPPHKDIVISHADMCDLDELDEEFDTFPTSRSHELVRMRYDRLRSASGRLQNLAGDVATLGERFLALLSWQDRYATIIFGIFCLVAAVLVYVTPFQVIAAAAGLYTMRHPRFRSPLPALPVNFLSRLPDRQDAML